MPAQDDMDRICRAFESTRDTQTAKFLLMLICGVEDEYAIDLLLQRLDDLVAGLRVAIIEALGQLGYSKAVEPLIALLQDGNSEVFAAASRALGRLKDARASSAGEFQLKLTW